MSQHLHPDVINIKRRNVCSPAARRGFLPHPFTVCQAEWDQFLSFYPHGRVLILSFRDGLSIPFYTVVYYQIPPQIFPAPCICPSGESSHHSFSFSHLLLLLLLFGDVRAGPESRDCWINEPPSLLAQMDVLALACFLLLLGSPFRQSPNCH